MALILNGTTGITVTDGSNILQDGTVTTDDLANNAVTSAKMAVGAAATNLGNYVASVNGSTGAVTVQATLVSGSNIKTINSTSLLGSGDITISSSPTTAQVLSATAGLTITSVQAPVGAYALLINRGSSNDYNLGNTLGGSVLQGVGCNGNNGSTFQTGTWRCMGFSNDVNNSNASTLWLRIS